MAARRATASSRTTRKTTTSGRSTGSKAKRTTTKGSKSAARTGTRPSTKGTPRGTTTSTTRGTNGRTTKPATRPGSTGATVTLSSKTTPKGPWATVTPHLVVDGAANAMAWYTKAFGAKELSRQLLPNGKMMHAMMQIGDSAIMLADPFNGPVPARMTGVTLHIQDAGINTFWANALAGGAKVEQPLEDQFWGDRYGQLRDPFGHLWSFGWPAKMTEAQKETKLKAAYAMMGGSS
jgi:PhnB protein